MNDQSEAPKLWAAKGETVTCTQGHSICDIAHDIYIGQPRAAGHFTNWHQPQPDHYKPVADIACTECGGSWINGNPSDGYRFHFPDGWR